MRKQKNSESAESAKPTEAAESTESTADMEITENEQIYKIDKFDKMDDNCEMDEIDGRPTRVTIPNLAEIVNVFAQVMVESQERIAAETAKAKLNALKERVRVTENSVKDAIQKQIELKDAKVAAVNAAIEAENKYEAQADVIAKAEEAARKAKRALELHMNPELEPITAGAAIDPELKQILSALSQNKDANQFYLDTHISKINEYEAIKADLEGPKGVR